MTEDTAAGFDYEDHLGVAQSSLVRAGNNLDKVVAPPNELLIAYAQAHALCAIAEYLEVIAYDDPPIFPTAKQEG